MILNHLNLYKKQLFYRKYIYFIVYFLCEIYTKSCIKVGFKHNFIEIFINTNYLPILITFLKNHSYFQTKILVDISALDNIGKLFRFELNYFLLSTIFNTRIVVKTYVCELDVLYSLCNVYMNSCWFEREVWDMFGIFFWKHVDLRRLLLDYGFKGHPLKKEYPLCGFDELFYNDSKRSLQKLNVFLIRGLN